MTNAERYAITTRKVVVDGEELWRATVRELPDVAEFSDTREEATDLLVDTIEALASSAAKEGRTFPPPIDDADEEFSGRVTLRLPKSLHRQLAIQADIEGVSLNANIVNALIGYVQGSISVGTAIQAHGASSDAFGQYVIPNTIAFEKFVQTGLPAITAGAAFGGVMPAPNFQLHVASAPTRSDVKLRATSDSDFQPRHPHPQRVSRRARSQA